MPLTWSRSIDALDWEELSALFEACPPMGNKTAADLLRLSAGHKKIILYSVPGSEAFYRKFGFRTMRTAMAIFENQDAAMERGYVEGA